MTLIERSLSAEQRAVRERAESFATEVVAERAEAIEESGKFPRDVIEEAGDRGLLGILVPEEYGGLGADFVAYCLAIERIAADPTLVAPPDLGDSGGEADGGEDAGGDGGDTSGADGADQVTEDYRAFAAKRGTYWRWVRPVFGGEIPRADDENPDPDGTADSVRIEYRPLPTQPTIRDTIGMQALVTGVLRGVDAADHPLATLPWKDAEASFYAAVDDGPDADLRWMTRDGEETTATGRIYDELFALARRGLDELGVESETIEWALGPIEARREATHSAPSAWKRARVRENLADGASVAEAITEMQRTYVERSASGTPYAQW